MSGSSARVAEATAPARIDLAGGTLESWPAHLVPPGAVAVSVAVDRRAYCKVELVADGVHLESKDNRAQADGRDVAEVLRRGVLPLPARILKALGVETGMKVVTQSRVPAESGLGASSALAVAVAAAVARVKGLDLDADALAALARDAEAEATGAPIGRQGHLAAIHGGVLEGGLGPGGLGARRLPTDPGRVEESLLLVDAGAGRSAAGPGELRGDADDLVGPRLQEIAAAAAGVSDALGHHRYADVAGLIDAEWQALRRLAPGVTSPEVERIVEVARSTGGAGKALGAGGGGLVALWAAPGRCSALVAALAAVGLRPVPFRLDLRGLEVE